MGTLAGPSASSAGVASSVKAIEDTGSYYHTGTSGVTLTSATLTIVTTAPNQKFRVRATAEFVYGGSYTTSHDGSGRDGSIGVKVDSTNYEVAKVPGGRTAQTGLVQLDGERIITVAAAGSHTFTTTYSAYFNSGGSSMTFNRPTLYVEVLA